MSDRRFPPKKNAIAYSGRKIAKFRYLAHIPQVLLVVLQIICTLHKWCSSLIRITSNGVVQMYYSICRVNLRNVGLAN